MSERKTVKVQIVTGYVPETDRRRADYFARIFRAFWNLAESTKRRVV